MAVGVAMKAGYVKVLWIDRWSRSRGGPKTCVDVPVGWLAAYRRRIVEEWGGVVLGVYRPRAT